MFNPEMGSREPEQEIPQEEEQNNFSEAKEPLEKEFQKKTFSEKHFAEVQTREAGLRGAKNPEQTRGEVFRFERGQILKGYKILREQIRDAKERGEDTTKKKEFLKEIRGRAKVLEKNLDELERQYYEKQLVKNSWGCSVNCRRQFNNYQSCFPFEKYSYQLECIRQCS